MAFLISCEKDANSITETEILEESKTQLIDESYAPDLELLKNIPIVFENGQYTIEQVLTDSSLFSEYENAHIHHLEENGDLNTKTLYITSEDTEKAEKMIAGIQTSNRTAKTNGNNSVNFTLKLFDNKNFGGAVFTYRYIGDINGDQRIQANVGSSRRNKANSMTSADLSSGIDTDVDFVLYTGTNQSGKSKSYSSIFNSVSNLGTTNLGNDAVASFRVNLSLDDSNEGSPSESR